MSKTIQKFVYKCWFDKKRKQVIGFNTKAICSECPLKQKAGVEVGYPPEMSGLYVVDLDQNIAKPNNPDAILCEGELILRPIEQQPK